MRPKGRPPGASESRNDAGKLHAGEDFFTTAGFDFVLVVLADFVFADLVFAGFDFASFFAGVSAGFVLTDFAFATELAVSRFFAVTMRSV
jgi:hypothetical protein